MKRRKHKPKHLVRYLFLALALLVIGGLGWKISEVFLQNVWDGRNRISLVFFPQDVSRSVFVASFNPSAKSLDVLMIPNNAFIEVIYGYGPYRADKVYQLGELEKRNGGKLLAESIQEYLGIPIDAYASVQNAKCLPRRTSTVSSVEPQAGKAQSAKEIQICLQDTVTKLIRSDGKTNLTKWDLMRLWWKIRGVRGDKIKMIDLKEVSASEEIALPDGTKAIKIDPKRLEIILSQLFTDEGIKQDDFAIVILNGTNHNGLANKGTKLISNIGGRVVGMGDIGSVGSKCQVRSKKKNKNSYTVQKLMRIFDCEWGGEDLENQRADVVLILDEKYWQKLNLP